MTILEETKFIINKYNIHPNKKLGQNFLFDEDALNKMTEEITKEDTIIEIGPGLGTLTSILLRKAKKVIVIEIDNKMVEILKDRFKLNDNLEIINEDVLKININNLAKNPKVVANLPYYITTSIITNLLKTDIKEIKILIQKEVAQRICAYPGEKLAGAITYYVNYYADAKILYNVSKDMFIPNPEVESCIVKLKKLNKPRVKVEDEELFFNIIKENFTKRRKTITNSLSNTLNKEKLIRILHQMNISEKVRGETLTLEQFAQISNLYKDIK